MPAMTALFREIEHTADLAIAVDGGDLAELFARSGLALFALLIEPGTVRGSERRRVEAAGRDAEDLLHEWLAVLLGDFYVDGFVAAEITTRVVDGRRVEADLVGERFDRARHGAVREIKAVTYHGLAVRRTAAGWEARVTFDV